MNTPEETLEESGKVLPDPKVLVPDALQEVNAVFMGPVEDGYFQPIPDKANTPPRWEQGSYSLAAGKWPSPGSTADLMDLSSYNGYTIMVVASAWNKEVISQARIFGVLSPMAGDVVAKYGYSALQAKEEEIANYISGISN
ncbi:hypothetical protein [Pontibacter roseus]|uniref:hypothetical protein n=1 Tax=Pontibacter roseus TaxID=336989 RepID=UPI00037559F9|nr:hypothetical protein [Pontibacter roseus]